MAGPWARGTVHVNHLIEAGRNFSGVDLIVKRQEKDYSLNYWYDCFASVTFRRKGLVDITNAIEKALEVLTKLEATMSGSIQDASGDPRRMLEVFSQTIGVKKGAERAELRKATLRWALSEFTDMDHAKAVRAEAITLQKKYRKSVKELGSATIEAFGAFVDGIRDYISRVIPLRNFRRKVSRAKQYAKILLEDTHTFTVNTAAKHASDPVDATIPHRQQTYQSLTRLLSHEEKAGLDDWKDGLKSLNGKVWEIKSELEAKIKEEGRSINVRERQQNREELERLLADEGNGKPKTNKKRKSLEEIQRDLAEDEDLEAKKKGLEQELKGRDREEKTLNSFDEDIEHVREIGGQTKFLSKAKFGFVTAGIIAANSFVSDPIGVKHLKRNKIEWKWVAGSYIAFKNATVFGWKSSLDKDGKFDPVYILRRIKRKKPKSLWAKNDYQIIGTHFAHRDGYTYAFVLPAVKSNTPTLNQDRDITIRNWDFAAAKE